nr:sigma 54-interacting transcriptional regulator [Bacillus timonensis]
MYKRQALYKLNSPLKEKISKLLRKLNIEPLSLDSQETLLNQKLSELILILPSMYITDVDSLKIPTVPISITLNDIEATIQTKKLDARQKIFIGTEDEIKWLQIEISLGEKLEYQLLNINNLHSEFLNEEAVYFISSWHHDTPIPNTMKQFVTYIEPTLSSLTSYVRQAISLIYLANEMMREKYQTQAIVNSSHDGIVVVDQEGHILLTNQNAKNTLGLQGRVIGNKISELIPNSDMLRVLHTGKKEIGDFAKIHDKQIVINRLPVVVNNNVVGAVSNFKEITDIQKLEMKIRKILQPSGLEAKYRLDDIVGTSSGIVEAKENAKLFASTDSTVLITGESGTGKELFAQGIHIESNRAVGPFVAVNCAAFPDSLLESELFGYEEGSFTGASRGGKQGLFELAHGGTLFLDEIGEIPLRIQALLLRVLQEKSIRRIGGKRTIPVDVRIIAATNRNLEEEIEKKQFRTDLFYRINVLSLELPPLRARIQDIPLLVQSIIQQFNVEGKKEIELVEESLLKLFQSYHWPGNIRELKNMIERIIVLSKGRHLTIDNASFLSKKIQHNKQKEIVNGTNIEEKEKELIVETLNKYNNKTIAARQLGIDRSTLWRKIKKYNL